MQFKVFNEAIAEREQEFELTELIYFGAIERLREVQNDVSKLDKDRHIHRVMKLFLICWGMNRVVRRKDFNWKGLTETLRKLEPEFALLRGKRFLDSELFDDKTVCDAIKKIYGDLKLIPHVGSTTISKILHLLNPEIFVMLDGKILKGYHDDENKHVNHSANGYVEFLKDSQRKFLTMTDEVGKTIDMMEKELRNQHPNRTIANLIDIYNWKTYHPENCLPLSF